MNIQAHCGSLQYWGLHTYWEAYNTEGYTDTEKLTILRATHISSQAHLATQWPDPQQSRQWCCQPGDSSVASTMESVPVHGHCIGPLDSAKWLHGTKASLASHYRPRQNRLICFYFQTTGIGYSSSFGMNSLKFAPTKAQHKFWGWIRAIFGIPVWTSWGVPTTHLPAWIWMRPLP